MVESASQDRLYFRRRHRLSGRKAFASVYGARCSKHIGPLTVHSRPNELSHPRLGLSVSSKVGTAVLRSTIKRRLREAFRLRQRELPAGYDLVVVVRRHEPLTMDEYGDLLERAAQALERQWKKRRTT